MDKILLKLMRLRLLDLQAKLKRRGLPKYGNKADLIERLAKAVKEEDMEDIEFRMAAEKTSSKVKRSSTLQPMENDCQDDVAETKFNNKSDFEAQDSAQCGKNGVSSGGGSVDCRLSSPEPETPATKQKSKSGKEGSSEKDESVSSKNLFVSGIAEKARTLDLKSLFYKFGKVEEVKILHKKSSHCYGLIRMASPEEADYCREMLNKFKFLGQIITVEKPTKNNCGPFKRADLESFQGSQSKKNKKRLYPSKENRRSHDRKSHSNENRFIKKHRTDNPLLERGRYCEFVCVSSRKLSEQRGVKKRNKDLIRVTRERERLSFSDYGRDRGIFDRRGRSKGGDISPTFNTSGRREERHEQYSFHRGSRNPPRCTR